MASERHSWLVEKVRLGIMQGVSMPMYYTTYQQEGLHALRDLEEQLEALERIKGTAREVETLAFRQYVDWMHLHEKAMVDPFSTEAEAQDFARRVSSLLTLALGADSTIEVIGDSSPAKEPDA